MVKPVFVVSTGRSGTYSLYRALSCLPDVEAVHQTGDGCLTTQQLGTCLYHGRLTEVGAVAALEAFYTGPRWSTRLFIDVSNKLSWLVQPLAQLFPEARFVHLLRDGRSVCSSYFHKFDGSGPGRDPLYEDDAINLMYLWLDDRTGVIPAPPPAERFWWPVPKLGTDEAVMFHKWDRFRRIAWHWAECNQVVLAAMAGLDPIRVHTVHLEDLVSQQDVWESLLEFLGLDALVDAWAKSWSMLQRPANVVEPMSYALTDEQQSHYAAVAGEMHFRLGYDWEKEKAVRYG